MVEALLNPGNNPTFEGKYQEAESLLVRALAASAKTHGEKSSQTLFALNRVCIIKRVLGKFDEAESAIKQAVDGAKECFFNEGFYPWTLENLALLREAEKKTDDAAKVYARQYRHTREFAVFPLTKRQKPCTIRADAFCGWETWLRLRRQFDAPSV